MKKANQKFLRIRLVGNSRGFGLVELMIAITIGLILLGGIGYVYLGSRQTFRTQDGFSRIQENVRYALDQVGVDVRMAGYAGCVNLASINPANPSAIPITVVANGAPTVGLDQAMRGYDGTTWTAPGTAPANWVSGTGVFVITRASEAGVNVTGNTTPSNANLQITGNPANFVPEEALLVSDCRSADLFRAVNVSGGTVTISTGISNCANIGMACNTQPFLGASYGNDAEVFRMISNTYFIGTNPAGVPALYRRPLNGNAEELVDNVENIVMRFGIDTAPTDTNLVVNSYVSASAVTDWRQVLTARLSMVFRSNSNNIATQVQPYVVEGSTVTPATTDRRLRQVATATFGLRNRLP
jgi:type IV pilus assembly protein PilW